MPDDQARIDALRRGLTHSKDDGFVAIRVADLRWLLERAETVDPDPFTDDEWEGNLDEPERE